MSRLKKLFSRNVPAEGEPSQALGLASDTEADGGAGLFASCAEQVENVRRWSAEREWGFAESDFANVADPSGWPKWPAGRLIAVVLVPYLDDTPQAQGIQRTFDELWIVAADRQQAAETAPGLLSDPGYLRLLSGIGHRPGFRWEIIDLGANRGQDPVTVRDAETSPHAGVLAAACHFPAWIQTMTGEEEIPYVYLPAYEATQQIPEGFVHLGTGESAREEPWKFIPGLHWNRGDRQMRLYLYGVIDAAHPYWAVPILLESQSERQVG